MKQKEQSKILEIQSKERIEMVKLEAEIKMKVAELEVKSDEIKARYAAQGTNFNSLNQEAAELDQRQKVLGFEEPFNQDEIAERIENEINNDQINPTDGMSSGNNGPMPGME